MKPRNLTWSGEGEGCPGGAGSNPAEGTQYRTQGRREMKRIAIVAGVIAALLVAPFSTSSAAAASPVYSGRGWKALTSAGVYSLHPGPYTVTFASQEARKQLYAYVKIPAAYISKNVGVQIKVTKNITPGSKAKDPGRLNIVLHYKYRPTGKKNTSEAIVWHFNSNGAAYGGHVLMDSESWKWRNEITRKNSVGHEFMHTLGLDHPNSKGKAYACPKSKLGSYPLACAPCGGHLSKSKAGQPTGEFDALGLIQLRENYDLRK